MLIMENSAITCSLGQTNLSGKIRASLKRQASERGGLASMMRELGLPYKKAWEQLNRNQGVLVDILPVFALAGIDEPLRAVADACGCDVTPKMKFLRRKPADSRPVRSHALDIHHAAAAVTMRLEEALLDRRIDERENEAIKSALHGLRKKMAELEARIDAEVLG